MSNLIDDLLNLSRIDCGKISIHLEPIDLAEIVVSATEAVRPSIDEREQRLELTLPDQALIFEADPLRLTQVLTNLLINASKFTDRGGRIWLTAAADGDDAVIWVRDDGFGIAPEALEHVFDMFAQASNTADHAAGGLGIGLALVHRLVELHGGSVSAFSGGPGRGSEFIVRIPRAWWLD